MADPNTTDDLLPPLLRARETCWRMARATRAAFLVDAADYYAAVKAAMRNARESIFIAAWDFDGRTRLSPEHPEAPDELASFLGGLLERRASLRIRVLKWRMPFAGSWAGERQFAEYLICLAYQVARFCGRY